MKRWVNSQDCTREVNWVRQHLENECKLLPLVRVDMEGEFGRILTKDAIKADELDQRYYLMSNKTSQLISAGNFVPISTIIRSAAKRNNFRGTPENVTLSMAET